MINVSGTELLSILRDKRFFSVSHPILMADFTEASANSSVEDRDSSKETTAATTTTTTSNTATSNTTATNSSSASSSSSNSSSQKNSGRDDVVVKIGLVGDAQVGKTTLMVKYVENKFDEDYIQTLGVNFMEKSIVLRNTEITFSIWDLGGHAEFLHMLPLVCNEAVAIFFMFDLSRKSTLLNVKEWYRQARGLNRSAHTFLIGTKYDVYTGLPPEEIEEIDKLARKYAKAMKAPLIFCSASHSINVQKIFKIVLAKVFDLRSTVQEVSGVGEPLLLF